MLHAVLRNGYRTTTEPTHLATLDNENTRRKCFKMTYLVSDRVDAGPCVHNVQFVWLCVGVHDHLDVTLVVLAALAGHAHQRLTGPRDSGLTLRVDPRQHLQTIHRPWQYIQTMTVHTDHDSIYTDHVSTCIDHDSTCIDHDSTYRPWQYTHRPWQFTHRPWQFTHRPWQYTNRPQQYTHTMTVHTQTMTVHTYTPWQYTHRPWQYIYRPWQYIPRPLQYLTQIHDNIYIDHDSSDSWLSAYMSDSQLSPYS